MNDQTNQPPGFERLRAIPISTPGVAGFSFAFARTDEEERAAREKADALGLLHGHCMTFPRP
jgi:hypothetical protein